MVNSGQPVDSLEGSGGSSVISSSAASPGPLPALRVGAFQRFMPRSTSTSSLSRSRSSDSVGGRVHSAFAGMSLRPFFHSRAMQCGMTVGAGSVARPMRRLSDPGCMTIVKDARVLASATMSRAGAASCVGPAIAQPSPFACPLLLPPLPPRPPLPPVRIVEAIKSHFNIHSDQKNNKSFVPQFPPFSRCEFRTSSSSTSISFFFLTNNVLQSKNWPNKDLQ